MNVGMLWLDDSKQRSFEEKVQRAAEYYQYKYGHSPELCFVNVKMITGEKTVGKVTVQTTNTVLLHHFWLGMKSQ